MESILRPTKKLIEALRKPDEKIDLSLVDFSFPIMILPLSALISENSLEYTLPKNKNCADYLKYFNFPEGFSEFISSSKYIPIYKFSASKADEKSITDKSNILKNLIGICLEKLGSPNGSVNALNISVDEIISNIEDHSEAEYGWINAQYYPSKEYLDICIVDRGITINGKYQKVGKNFGDDREALKCALLGESAKPEKIRGSGLPTFTSMITQGFKGEMVIISGNAIVYANEKSDPVVQKLSVRWDGTIVALRIPKNSKSIDYTLHID